MQKKTIVIISLVSVVLSLIYILLDYFGFIRCIKLYFSPTEMFVSNYKKLDQIDKKRRVVVCLTTTPNRIKKLGPAIRSLLDQTVKVNIISIVVPYGKQYKLPGSLKNAVKVFNTSKTYGDLTSLIPTAMREGDATTQIINVGDSKIYGKDFIESLLTAAEKAPGKIIYNSKENTPVIDLNEGVLFETDFFTEDFFTIPEKYTSSEWLNKYFENFPKVKINYKENYNML